MRWVWGIRVVWLLEVVNVWTCLQVVDGVFTVEVRLPYVMEVGGWLAQPVADMGFRVS